MYLGSYDIDDLLSFYVNTHDPATAGQVDADAVPGYRVYEDETTAPLLTGSMAKLDDGNTTGYYSEQITLSAANGFERGKCYNIRITGVVGGVTAVATRQFQVAAKVDVRSWLGTTPATPGTAGVPSVDAVRVSTSATAADNLETAALAYSATRGLAGTALPAAAADAAGGLPISDAGGLDLDSKLANTNEVTAARMGALTDWINGGRLDLLLDAIKAVTDALPNAGALTDLATAANLATVAGYIDTEVATLLSRLGTPSDLGSGATVAANLVDIEAETDDWNDGQRLDLLLDAVKAKTDNLPADPADASDIVAAFSSIASTLATIATYIDTEVATLLSRLGTPSDLGSGATVAGNLVDIEGQTDDVGAAGAGLTALASAANLATLQTAVTAIKAITDAIGATAAANLAKSCGAAGIVAGATIAGTLSTTQFSTDLTEATNDHYKGRTVVFITGVLAGQASDITAYTGATKVVTVTAMTEAPGAGDTFVIV